MCSRKKIYENCQSCKLENSLYRVFPTTIKHQYKCVIKMKSRLITQRNKGEVYKRMKEQLREINSH